MSIENNMASIAKSLEIIAKVMSEGVKHTPVPAPIATPAPEPIPTPVSAPVAAAIAVEVPKVEVPTIPTPTPVVTPEPVASVTTPSAPFSDAKGLIEYTMAAFRALGPKGNDIQAIMQGMGVSNINDMKPEQYGEFYTKVEALKG